MNGKHNHIRKIDIDIDKINSFEKRSKGNTKEWSTIYEVIEEAYFK